MSESARKNKNLEAVHLSLELHYWTHAGSEVVGWEAAEAKAAKEHLALGLENLTPEVRHQGQNLRVLPRERTTPKTENLHYIKIQPRFCKAVTLPTFPQSSLNPQVTDNSVFTLTSVCRFSSRACFP